MSTQNGVFPKIINIKTNNNRFAAQKGVSQGKQKWLNQDKETQYRHRDLYNIYLWEIHSELLFWLHDVELKILNFNTMYKVVTQIFDQKFYYKKTNLTNKSHMSNNE